MRAKDFSSEKSSDLRRFWPRPDPVASTAKLHQWPARQSKFANLAQERWVARRFVPILATIRARDPRRRSDGSDRQGRQMTQDTVTVRPLRATDQESWRKLWTGYLTFYEASVTEAS